MSRSQPLSDDVLGLESSLEALQESPEFRGPVEPMDGQHCNDHFALLYESREDQLAAAIPFIRQGLDRGERCIYVVDDEESAVAVRTALADAGVDVEEAAESGQFSVEFVSDTYLRTGEFDPDEMIEFYASFIEEATEEWAALRIAAETSWLQHESTSVEAFMEYEAKVNRLFDDEDCIALCQYDRTAFDPSVVQDIVRTHPHLIYDCTVCHNFYHTPPSDYFGPERPSHDVDRMLGTLLDRTEAKAELERREQYLREQNEIISSPELSFEEKLLELLDLGTRRLDLEFGGVSRLRVATNSVLIEHLHDDRDTGVELPLSESFCRETFASDGVTTVADAEAEGYADIEACQEFGIRAYIGTHVPVEEAADRALWFAASEPLDTGFTDDQYTFIEQLGQWMKYELEQHHRERRLETTVERLERSNERLEQFANAASHDLQEPLRMVSSYLQLIESRADDELAEETREYLQFAVDGADRMRAMIDGLLQYSRVETRGEPLEPVSLDVVLGEVLDDLRLRIDETDATVDCEPLPTVQGDANQLRQVLQNLIDNAIKYSGDGPPEIEIEAERAGGDYVVSVADDGPGIDPGEADRIFDVFERLHGRDDEEGTGIGLALCERIVERHGGDVWVESEPGEGATFSLSLPAADVSH